MIIIWSSVYLFTLFDWFYESHVHIHQRLLSNSISLFKKSVIWWDHPDCSAAMLAFSLEYYLYIYIYINYFLKTVHINYLLKLYSFNATLMLETLRGKRMMFVGDSLNRGQYISMVCLLHRLIPENAKSMETFNSLTVFTAKVTFIYNAF